MTEPYIPMIIALCFVVIALMLLVASFDAYPGRRILQGGAALSAMLSAGFLGVFFAVYF